MAEVNEAIEKGEEIEDDKLNELVFIYDKKRLYPYIQIKFFALHFLIFVIIIKM